MSISIATGQHWSTAREATRIEMEPLWSESGLAVHPTWGGSGWTITHIASGFAVKSGVEGPQDAVFLARRLLDAGDWTRSRTAVTTDRRLRDKVADILIQARLLGLCK